MSTPVMLWFVFWRMTLWGIGLLAASGTAFGLLTGMLTFPYGIGFALMGPVFGAAVGLCVGPLEGVVLGVVTVLHHRGYTPHNPVRYRRAAGVACAVVCIVALALIFELLARKSGTSLVSIPAYDDSEDIIFVVMVVVAPSLTAAWASWWAGKKIAGQYAHKASEQKPWGFYWRGMFWNFLWRASLYGAFLGAFFGALYAGVFGALVFRLLGATFGFFSGMLTGIVVGLPLGLLDGLLLFALTATFVGAGRIDVRRYRRAAGIVCMSGGFFALMVDWRLHGLPDPRGFVTSRTACLPIYLFDPPCGQAISGLPDAITLTIWVFVPALMILLASWMTGRAVAGQYALSVPRVKVGG